jgi:hypothetical protein
MTENNLVKKQKRSWIDVITDIGITIVAFSLLIMFLKFRYPWNIVALVNMAILLVIQLLKVKKADDEHKIIEKKNTILEWVEPRKAWHITEARWFSPIALIALFAVCFLVFFSFFAIVIKYDPPPNPSKDTLTFAKLSAFSAGVGIFIVVLYASLWWWAQIKVKLTTYGIERTLHNSTKTWKYDRIKSYHFEPLHSQTDVYILFVLCNHKGKTWKIALANPVDKTKIEETLKEHGIPKLEQAT